MKDHGSPDIIGKIEKVGCLSADRFGIGKVFLIVTVIATSCFGLIIELGCYSSVLQYYLQHGGLYDLF